MKLRHKKTAAVTRPASDQSVKTCCLLAHPGAIVVKDSKVPKGVYPGQPIRLPDSTFGAGIGLGAMVRNTPGHKAS